MELSDYLLLVKRNWKVLVALPLLLALGAFVNSNRQAKLYQSTATVLLKPGDPNERFGTANVGSATELVNSSRIVKSLASIADGPDVAEAAAEILGGGLTSGEVQSAVSVSTSADSNIMKIRATTRTPERSAAIANQVALAYIDNRRNSSVEGLKRAIANLDGKISTLTTRLTDLGRQPVGAAVTAELETARAQFQDLSERRQQLEIDAELKRGEAEVTGAAKPSSSPISPKPMRSAMAGLVAGLILAAGITLLKDRLDMRLRSRDEAEELTGLPTLAEIPVDRRVSRDPFHIAALQHPDGIVAEAIRSLRVSLRFISLEQQLRVMLVTSPMPGDGKSTVATNLAASYAVSGARTLLISADLRRPRVESLTEVRAQTPSGLVEILSGIAEEEERRLNRARKPSSPARSRGARSDVVSVDDYPAPPTRRRRQDEAAAAVRSAGSPGEGETTRQPLDILSRCHSEAENLWVLPAGQPVANPVEILGSPVAKDFFAAARDQFDIVIVDSPPVLPVSDTLVMSGMVDGVLLVASLRTTNYKHVARGVERLRSAQANVVGIVLNKVPRDGENDYYGRANQDE